MKYLALLLFCLPLLAQDAVNPCAVNTRTLDCSAPDGPAEAEFRQIKLNGRRKEDPTVAAGEDLVLAATLKYTKRAQAVVTTTFTGSGGSTCPDRIENQRLKPELDVTYSAALTITGSTLNYSGTGLEFTIPGSALSGASAAVLTVTFTVAGSSAPGCLATPYPSMTKVFTLLVDDGSFYGEIIAENDDEADDTDYSDAKRMPPVVPEHSYFLVDQDRKIKFTANFTTQGGTTAANDQIHWSVTPASAGTFTNGATGKTVKFRQGAYQSLALDDIVVRAEGPDNAAAEFKLSYISVDPLEVQMSTSETRQFVVPEANIHPTTANKDIIVGILGQPEIVGNKFNGVRLRTREHSGLALASESFVPGEALQWAHTGRVLLRGIYLHIANTLVLEVSSSTDEGTYNLSWEIKRLFHSERRFLHHAVVQVEDVPLPTTLTLVKDGTSDTGPFPMGLDGAQLHLRALTSGGTFASGFPTWAIQAPPGSSITPPPAGTDHANFLFDKPGTYTFTVTENGQTDEATVLVYGIDLDADSDNDNGLANPAGGPAEDMVENSSPGKILISGMGDTDGDLIPDFADGYDRDAGTAAKDNVSTHNLVPVVLRLPEPTDPTVAQIQFTYPKSRPIADVTTDNDPLLPLFSIGAGSLRLWLKDGNQPRHASAVPTGDFVDNNTYNASNLGFTETHREVVFYIESVKGSNAWGDQFLEVALDYDGIGPAPPIQIDRVVFSSVSLAVTPLSLLQTGVSHTLTASALPSGGSFDWALTQGAERATVTGPYNTSTLQVTANQFSENVGDIVATIAYTAPVPGGTPATIAQLAVPLPAYRIGFIRDDGDANPNDDPILTYLDVSNELTTQNIDPATGHIDPDNFKLQVSGPFPAATIPDTAISIEMLKPDGTSFSAARLTQKALDRVPGTSHFRSEYMRLVVDEKDLMARPGQTVLADFDPSDESIEILGQRAKLRFSSNIRFDLNTQVPVGHDVRTFQVAGHWLSGVAGVSNASVTTRVFRDVRRKYAQVNMRPILHSVEEISAPHNLATVSNKTGNPASGGGIFSIQVMADRGGGGIVSWNISSSSVATRTPYQTAGQLETALESAAPSSGGLPGDRLVVSRFQNSSNLGADSAHRSADLLITDPGGGMISLIVSSSDATQSLSAPPVMAAMIASEGNNSTAGTIEQRSLIRNYDTGSSVFDFFVSDTLTKEVVLTALAGQSKRRVANYPAHQQGIDPIRNNVFLKGTSGDGADDKNTTLSHELAHCLLDAGHAATTEQVMRKGGALGSNSDAVTSRKRFGSGSVSFDEDRGMSGPVNINQVTRLRAHPMTSGKQKTDGALEDASEQDILPVRITAAPVASDDQDDMAMDDLLYHLDHIPRFQALLELNKRGGSLALGAELGRQLLTEADPERASELLALVAKLQLVSAKDAISQWFEQPERTLPEQLRGLRALLLLNPSEQTHQEVGERIAILAQVDHTSRVQLLQLTWLQPTERAYRNLLTIRELAEQSMATLRAEGLSSDIMAELGSWGDILNRANWSLRMMDLFTPALKAPSPANQLVGLYLENWADDTSRIRVLTEIRDRNQTAAVIARVRDLQGQSEEQQAFLLLSLRETLFDTLNEAEQKVLKQGLED